MSGIIVLLKTIKKYCFFFSCELISAVVFVHVLNSAQVHAVCVKNRLCCAPVVNMADKTEMLIVKVEKHPILYDKVICV